MIVGELQDALRVQEEIEEYGGDVSFLTGDERFDIMERIGTAGITVVVVLDALTPHGLSKINDISEKYRLPVLYTKIPTPRAFDAADGNRADHPA